VNSPPDVSRLQSFLDGRWAEVRAEVRAQLREPLFHPVHGLDVESYRQRVFEQTAEIGKGPGPKLGFPERYGGGGDVGGFVTAFETLAFGDLSLLVKIGVQWGLFGGAILHLGTGKHHERYLRPMMNFELPGCFGMTETGHGSDVQSIRTTATYDPATREFVIHTPDEDARKDYIGNAARDGRMAVVFAQLISGGETHGVHAFLVPIRDDSGAPLPGVAIEDCGHKMGLNGVDNGRLWFDEVRVPLDAMLDRHAQVSADGTYFSPIENRTKRFFTMVGTLVQGRISVSGGAVSAAKVALSIATRYGLVRRQFSAPESDDEVILLDFRQHQRRLIPSLATTYALHFAQEELVAKLHDAFTTPDYPDEDKRRLESLAAGIKACTTWHATATIQTCREACGGAGYLSENRLPQLKADTDVFTTFEGDNTVLLQLVAKGLLTGYRDEFGSLDTLGMVRFVADQVVERVVERTAAHKLIQALIDAVPGREEDTDLFDRGYHLELFEWRERHVLEGVARRIKGGIDNGGDPFDVFNECQDHVLLAARVHMDTVVLEAFVAAIDRCDDPEVAALLNRLCDLYALSTIEADRGWYLEHGRLSAPRSKAIISAVNSLCAELRPHAALLVDAFGIPDEALRAPIALGEEAKRQDGKSQVGRKDSVAGFAPHPPSLHVRIPGRPCDSMSRFPDMENGFPARPACAMLTTSPEEGEANAEEPDDRAAGSSRRAGGGLGPAQGRRREHRRSVRVPSARADLGPVAHPRRRRRGRPVRGRVGGVPGDQRARCRDPSDGGPARRACRDLPGVPRAGSQRRPDVPRLEQPRRDRV
jgi:acyl-CoA oxidase